MRLRSLAVAAWLGLTSWSGAQTVPTASAPPVQSPTAAAANPGASGSAVKDQSTAPVVIPTAVPAASAPNPTVLPSTGSGSPAMVSPVAAAPAAQTTPPMAASAGTAAPTAASTAGTPAASKATQPTVNLVEPRAKAYLLRGGTILTVTQGTLSPGDVLIRDGRIAAVGANLPVPADAVVIDIQGQFLSPGLIDAHSHSGVAAEVNECTDAITAQVRIADILDPEAEALYRELAGGLTVANVLHGSCNPIGGQNAVIKLRYGTENPEGLLFVEAPPGIKFALGENVKQSNWDDATNRYPKSRMGVVQFIRDAFLRAQAYRERWNRYSEAQRRGDRNLLPPRRDLQLEALVEILEGKRLVHCHSYRADEILAMLRVAEEFGFKIKTFQHGLEAYRVADEIAAHGAGVSMFSDWWGYKMEVYDAIPYNAAICWQRGVLVSMNSDSDELARHLNTEAAKAVRYGGVPEDEAFKMVTLNPAIQLGIDKWVGSIEVGKHADLALWSHHPLDTMAVCQKTFVDGRIYFDRQRDLVERKQRAEEKASLKEAEKKAAEASKKETPTGTPQAAGTPAAVPTEAATTAGPEPGVPQGAPAPAASATPSPQPETASTPVATAAAATPVATSAKPEATASTPAPRPTGLAGGQP